MLKIIDNVLISNDVPLKFNTLNDYIEVVGAYPTSSVIMATIVFNNITESIPLICVATTEEGNVFKSKFFISKKLLNNINEHPDTLPKIIFSINGIRISGEQNFVINYSSLIRQIDAIPDSYQIILKEIATLKSDLSNLMHNKLSNNNLYSYGYSIGMSPIIVDTNGNYKWDFPFIKEKEELKNIANVLQDMSKQMDIFNTRLKNLEDKVTAHIYEQYEI